MTPPDPTPERTYRVVVTCPDPRHEFVVTVDLTDPDDPVVQACETVFALLNIGGLGIDDLPELGYAQQVDAVRSWYAHHIDLRPGVRLEVTAPDGTLLPLACDDVGCAHPVAGPSGSGPAVG
ncbi:MAG: hypothetical protein ACRDYX_03200 [Egibacteraceae bacterium]